MARVPEAALSARLVNEFIEKARVMLKGKTPANMLMLRGFSTLPQIPTMAEVYKMRAAGIAVYPMYRGLAKLVGMTVFKGGKTVEDEIAVHQKRVG